LDDFCGVSSRRDHSAAFRKRSYEYAPVFIGAAVLLPGDLIDQLFPRMPDTLVLILTMLVNLGVWYGILKVLRLDKSSASK
jgi:hypothetical protein